MIVLGAAPGLARFSELRVVTPARWLAEDLARGARIPVVHDLGLDVPEDVSSTAWWAPHGHIARLAVTAGIAQPDLASPGAAWLPSLSMRLLGRHVAHGAVSQLPAWSGPVFAKPAEIKISALPARVWNSMEEFASAARDAGLQNDSSVIVSEPLEFTTEVRAFIADRHVVASCVYLQDGVAWDAWNAGDVTVPAPARELVRHVAATSPAPSGYVVDVGRTKDRKWVVIEANAAWSSSPYHCDPRGVVEAIFASQRPGAADGWAWASDPIYANARPLQVSSPVT